MSRRLAAIVFVVVALLEAPRALGQLQAPLPSPNATVSQMIGVTKVEISYSRPHVKGPTRKEDRVIWGGLVPYDKVWRTGANAVTKITLDGDVSVDGQKLAAGSYGLFTIPGQSEWTVIFSKQSTGAPGDYKTENDALRVKVKARPAPMTDLFTISFPQVTADSAELSLAWEKLAVDLHLTVDTHAQFLSRARTAVAAAPPDDWRTPLAAARYLYDNHYASSDAAAFLDKSLAVKETFANLSMKAGALAADGNRPAAVAAAQKALALKDVEPKPSPEAVVDLEKKLSQWKTAK